MTREAAPPRLAIVAVGNAIVDVIARADDAFLDEQGMVKGSMRLIDAETAKALYDAMGPAVEMSGGSAANTLAGMAALGQPCGFIGQVADDQLGRVFAHDLTALGVAFTTPPRAEEPPTAQCLIAVTPDGQRTMNTFLGASQFLPPAALDEAMIADAAILYLEGYLWDPAEPRAAMRRAIAIARENGRRVAFTLSDTFVIDRHGDDFRALIEQGDVDILFANQAELASLTGLADFDAGVAALAPKVPLLVVTRGPDGAIAVAEGQRYAVDAEPIDHVVDTTGAGDLFAAGFLAALGSGHSIGAALTAGSICARIIIAQVGPRAQIDLKERVTARIGALNGVAGAAA